MSMTKAADFDLKAVTKDTTFILDTNILYFVHSGYYGQSNTKYKAYSNLIQQIITNGNTVAVSVLCLQELFFGIENKEYKIYCSVNNKLATVFTKKDFRRDTQQRDRIKHMLAAMLMQIKAAYRIDDAVIKLAQIDAFVADYQTHRYDPIDYIMVSDTALNTDVIYISDDTDFHTDACIRVVTA